MKQKKKEDKKVGIIQASLKLFAKKGFHATTIPDIAKALSMSVGNMYNYFASKEELAKFAIRYSTDILASSLKEINEKDITSKQKIYEFTREYFTMVKDSPEVIEYFLRVYLSNREVFEDGCEGFLCVGDFVTEVMILLEEGVKTGELREQEFTTAFSLFMGALGGFAFMYGENVLDKELLSYTDQIAENIYRALSSEKKT